MPLLRTSAVTTAPPRTALGVLLNLPSLAALCAGGGVEVMGGGPELSCGDALRLRTARRGTTVLRVTRVAADRVCFAAWRRGYREMEFSARVNATAAGTLVTLSCQWRSSP
ncbi:MAG: hypothetical protein ACRDRL_19415, partial [Sciscionella sp.]